MRLDSIFWIFNSVMVICTGSAFAMESNESVKAAPKTSIAKLAHRPAEVLGFQQWKKTELNNMQKKVANSQKALSDLVGKEFIESVDLTAERIRLESELERCEANLELVKELNVNDYFILYLSAFEDKQRAFLQAARKLGDQELAELLMAYDKSLKNAGDSDASKAAWMEELRAPQNDAAQL